MRQVFVAVICCEWLLCVNLVELVVYGLDDRLSYRLMVLFFDQSFDVLSEHFACIRVVLLVLMQHYSHFVIVILLLLINLCSTTLSYAQLHFKVGLVRTLIGSDLVL